MRIRTQCPQCGFPFRSQLDPDGAGVECPQCDNRREVDSAAWTDNSRRIETCPLCGCRHLYRQRDINRALGCTLIVVGAIFVPWTYGLSLVALSLVDLWLYRRLSIVVVCYKCDTVFRDAKPLDRQTDFDLLKHDVLKYGKTWDENASVE